MAKVSILVPVYNNEKFISRCADSLFRQTFEDVEFIFYDDCSDDKSVCLITECLERYPDRQVQTRIISGEQNSGVYVARNKLLAEAGGEYFWFVDGDDWIEPDAVRLLYEAACSSGADVVSFGFFEETTSGHIVHSFTYKSAEECLKDVIGHKWGVVWRFLFRKSITADNAIVFPPYKVSEDYVFCIRYLLHAVKITGINEALYHYVVYNQTSVTKRHGIHTLVADYECTVAVERLLSERGVLQLYSGDLALRKAWVVVCFCRFFHNKWGGLYVALLKRMIGSWKRKIRNLFRKCEKQ